MAQPSIFFTKHPVDVANIDARIALKPAADRLERIARALRAMGLSRTADDIQAIARELDGLSRSHVGMTRDASSGAPRGTDVER
jgi:hypothetical protein